MGSHAGSGWRLRCGRNPGAQRLIYPKVPVKVAVDIAAGWWEGQAIAVRSQHASMEGLDQIRERMPTRIRELHLTTA